MQMDLPSLDIVLPSELRQSVSVLSHHFSESSWFLPVNQKVPPPALPPHRPTQKKPWIFSRAMELQTTCVWQKLKSWQALLAFQISKLGTVREHTTRKVTKICCPGLWLTAFPEFIFVDAEWKRCGWWIVCYDWASFVASESFVIGLNFCRSPLFKPSLFLAISTARNWILGTANSLTHQCKCACWRSFLVCLLLFIYSFFFLFLVKTPSTNYGQIFQVDLPNDVFFSETFSLQSNRSSVPMW